MESETQASTDLDDLDDFCEGKPAGERWAPLGANDPEDEPACYMHSPEAGYCGGEADKLRELEEQQELLNSSLIALTTHFAQVQFRLRQIVDAPPDEKETLLKDLEEFAFRGIPDVREPKMSPHISSDPPDLEMEHKMAAQREKQKELISQLKEQLEELEHYAYETGGAGLPQSVMLERQKVIIDQLKGRLNLNVDNLDKLTVDDLKGQVDHAISQLVNPLKMKEQLVSQLKTQIIDLERFIQFLQGEGTLEHQECMCRCPMHSSSAGVALRGRCKSAHYPGSASHSRVHAHTEREVHEKTLNIMKKMATLLQMFALTQFGCGTDTFRKNSLKRTMKANHWGDMRARLEVAVGHVMLLASKQEAALPADSDYTSDTEDAPVVLCNEELTTAVRKELAPSLRDLLQHGLMPVGQSLSLVPFMGCFPQRSAAASGKMMHAWEMVLKYYQLKNGDLYNSTPARKLSQSFGIEVQGNSNKESLLGAIGNILATHSRYKRSNDSHFKAFICASLNARKLVSWLRMLVHYQPILESYYQPWSYVAKTGFEDSFQCLEKLSDFNFDLPVDLAVRQFQNIKDAF